MAVSDGGENHDLPARPRGLSVECGGSGRGSEESAFRAHPCIGASWGDGKAVYPQLPVCAGGPSGPYPRLLPQQRRGGASAFASRCADLAPGRKMTTTGLATTLMI